MKKYFLIVVVSLFSLPLQHCGEKPDAEVQIRENINQAKEGIESLKHSQVLDVLAEDFVANASKSSRMNVEQLKKYMMVQGLRKQNVSITLGPLDIKMDEFNTTLAHMETTAVITSSRGGLIPNDGKIYKVKGTWRLFDDEWLISEITWE